MSWNVRELNEERKRGVVRNMINQWGADVYIFVETKLGGNIDRLIHSIWDNSLMGQKSLERGNGRTWQPKHNM